MTHSDGSYIPAMGLERRALFYLMAMPRRPQWIAGEHFPYGVICELRAAGLAEVQEVGGPTFLRVTQEGELKIAELAIGEVLARERAGLPPFDPER